MNVNKLFIFIRKSSDLSDYSTASQEESINGYIRNELNLNPDQVAHKFSTVGSAYKTNTTHKEILSFIEQNKDIFLIVFDVSRLSRNPDFFKDILPRLKKNNVTICVTINQHSTKKQFVMSNPADVIVLTGLIQRTYQESLDKSNTTKRTADALRKVKAAKNKGLAIDKIYDLTLGRVRSVKEGYYRSVVTNYERKLKDGHGIVDGKIVKVEKTASTESAGSYDMADSDYDSEFDDLENEIDEDMNQEEIEYQDKLNSLLIHLKTKNSSIQVIAELLKELCLFPTEHPIHRTNSYTLKKILTAAKIKQSYGDIDYLPRILTSTQIDNIFDRYGIYFSTDLTPWSVKRIKDFVTRPCDIIRGTQCTPLTGSISIQERRQDMMDIADNLNKLGVSNDDDDLSSIDDDDLSSIDDDDSVIFRKRGFSPVNKPLKTPKRSNISKTSKISSTPFEYPNIPTAYENRRDTSSQYDHSEHGSVRSYGYPPQYPGYPSYTPYPQYPGYPPQYPNYPPQYYNQQLQYPGFVPPHQQSYSSKFDHIPIPDFTRPPQQSSSSSQHSQQYSFPPSSPFQFPQFQSSFKPVQEEVKKTSSKPQKKNSKK